MSYEQVFYRTRDLYKNSKFYYTKRFSIKLLSRVQKKIAKDLLALEDELAKFFAAHINEFIADNNAYASVDSVYNDANSVNNYLLMTQPLKGHFRIGEDEFVLLVKMLERMNYKRQKFSQQELFEIVTSFAFPAFGFNDYPEIHCAYFAEHLLKNSPREDFLTLLRAYNKHDWVVLNPSYKKAELWELEEVLGNVYYYASATPNIILGVRISRVNYDIMHSSFRSGKIRTHNELRAKEKTCVQNN